MHTFLRPRPQTDAEQEEGPSCLTVVDSSHVVYHPRARHGRQANDVQFGFTEVLDAHATQREVFEKTTMQPLRNMLVMRSNALMFTLGITNSGKTHTMLGTDVDAGVIPRCLDVLFHSLRRNLASPCTFKIDDASRIPYVQSADDAEQDRRATKGKKKTNTTASTDAYDFSNDIDAESLYGVFVSYIEIYNEKIIDLGSSPSSWENGARPRVIEDPSKAYSYVSNIREAEVHSVGDAMAFLEAGLQNRSVAATALNAASSRSHCVFTIRLLRARKKDLSKELDCPVQMTQMCLVDLAGSERAARTQHGGERLREANFINSSLTTLRICINQLREKQSSAADKFVNYRESVLTQLFKSFFIGNGTVSLILCTSQSAADADETRHVLEFAAVAQELKTATTPLPHLLPGRSHAARLQEEARNAMKPQPRFPMHAELDIVAAAAGVDHLRPGKSTDELAAYERETEAQYTQCMQDLDAVDQNFLEHLEDTERYIDNLEHDLSSTKESLSQEIQHSSSLDSQLRACMDELAQLKRHVADLMDMQASQRRELDDKEKEATKLRTENMRVTRDGKMQQRHAEEVQEFQRQIQALRQERQEQEAELDEARHVISVLKEILQEEGPSGQSRRLSLGKRHFSTSDVAASFGRPSNEFAVRFRDQAETHVYTPDISTIDPEATPSSDDAPKSTILTVEDKKAKKSILNHRPKGFIEPDTIISRKIKEKHTTVSTPKLKQFLGRLGKIKNDKYLLHHQDDRNEDHIIKGDVSKTIGGGVSVEFTGMDSITTTNMPTSTISQVTSASSLAPPMKPLSNLKRKGGEAADATDAKEDSIGKRTRRAEEVRERCGVGLLRNTGTLGVSVQHKIIKK